MMDRRSKAFSSDSMPSAHAIAIYPRLKEENNLIKSNEERRLERFVSV